MIRAVFLRKHGRCCYGQKLKSSATCSGVNRSSHDLKPDSGHETTLGKACVSSTTEEILKVLYIHDNPWEGMRIKYDGGNSENRVHSVQCEARSRR
jgi:hypothetical protein